MQEREQEPEQEREPQRMLSGTGLRIDADEGEAVRVPALPPSPAVPPSRDACPPRPALPACYAPVP